MASGFQIALTTAFSIGLTLLAMRLTISRTDRERVAALNSNWAGKLRFFWGRGGIQLRANCLDGYDPSDDDHIQIARSFFLKEDGNTRETFHKFISFYKSDGALLCYVTPAYQEDGLSLCLFRQKSLLSAELVPIKQLKLDATRREGAV